MVDINDSWYRVSIKAIIFNDKWQILLCKEENWVWDLPGWWLEHWEDIETCLKREIKEEMWLEVLSISDRPLCFVTFHKTYSMKRPWISNVCYEVKFNSLNFTKSNECMKIWFFDNESIKDIDVIWNVKEVFDNLFG